MGSIEPWDFIVSQKLGFLEGNVIKYITRAGAKDGESRLDDLLKAQAYIHKLVKTELHDSYADTRPLGSSDPIQEAYESADRHFYSSDPEDTAFPNY